MRSQRRRRQPLQQMPDSQYMRRAVALIKVVIGSAQQVGGIASLTEDAAMHQ